MNPPNSPRPSDTPLQERGSDKNIPLIEGDTGGVLFPRLPYNKKHTERAKELRKAMTPAERKIRYEYLQPLQKQIGMRILRQRPINQFIVDFYIPKAKLVIEIDGETHFTQEGKVYDLERTEILESLWITVLRFTNSEVMTNLEWVAFEIEKFLGK